MSTSAQIIQHPRARRGEYLQWVQERAARLDFQSWQRRAKSEGYKMRRSKHGTGAIYIVDRSNRLIAGPMTFERAKLWLRADPSVVETMY